MEAKKNKRTTIQMILENESFNPEQTAAKLREDVIVEEQMISTLKTVQQRVDDDVVEEQQIYTNFEKVFFKDLEQFVIDKKKKK